MGWVKITSIKKFPSTKGLYAIYDKTGLIYIGRSDNLYNRFSAYSGRVGLSHILVTIPKDDLYYKYKVTDNLWEEGVLIRRLKPRFNKCNYKQRNPRKTRIVSPRHKNEYFT